MPFSSRWSSHMSEVQNAHHQLLERDSRDLGRHRHEAVAGHARRGIDLQQRYGTVRAANQVGASPTAAAKHFGRPHHELLDLTLLRYRKTARADVLRIV